VNLKHPLRQIETNPRDISGKFRLSHGLHSPWGGKTYDELTIDEQDRIRTYSFPAEIFQGISDREVLEVFSRLNTYSVQLNAQELRNGRFFGEFKNCVYSLAYEHLEFWRRNKIFTERNIGRMMEVELTNELVVTQLAGMQEKKKTIDNFYSKFDDLFDARELHERRFREVIDLINDTFDTGLSETEFSRPPIFYSLFGTLYHRRFGLEGVALPTPKKSLTKDEKISLANAVAELSSAIESKEFGQEYAEFVTACLRQTDNIKPTPFSFQETRRNFAAKGRPNSSGLARRWRDKTASPGTSKSEVDGLWARRTSAVELLKPGSERWRLGPFRSSRSRTERPVSTEASRPRSRPAVSPTALAAPALLLASRSSGPQRRPHHS
jgi:hypothetical protein